MQAKIVASVIQKLHQKELAKPIEEEFLALLFEEIKELQTMLKTKGKSAGRDLDGIVNKDELAVVLSKTTRKKPKIKSNRLGFYKNEILKLRENGLSWRELEKYLAVRHKFKIDHTTIQKEVKKWLCE